MVSLQERLAAALAVHPAARIPVSDLHIRYYSNPLTPVAVLQCCRAAADWLAGLAVEHGWPPPEQLSTACNSALPLHPFVFRSVSRGGEVVSLLEEQTEQLTRGSTGLVSWQGAAALTDWAHWSHLLVHTGTNTVVAVLFLRRKAGRCWSSGPGWASSPSPPPRPSPPPTSPCRTSIIKSSIRFILTSTSTSTRPLTWQDSR